MIPQDELKRRAARFLAQTPAERPFPNNTLARLAGLNPDFLRDLARIDTMRPETHRRLSRVFELLENDRLPDPETMGKNSNRFKKIRLKRVDAPKCEPIMVLDLSSGTPKMRTEFINPLALPEIQFTKVRK